MRLLPQARARRLALLVAVIVLVAAGGAFVAFQERSVPDLSTGAVTVAGCPTGAGPVEVAARRMTRSVRPAPALPVVQRHPPRGLPPGPSAPPSATSSPSASATFPPRTTSSPSPSAGPAPTPSGTPVVTPSATPPPRTPPYQTMPPRTATPQPTAGAPGLVLAPASYGWAVVAARDAVLRVVPPVLARVSQGRFHFSGLTKGVVYQLGAKVAGCPTGKVVTPAGGLFVAGVTPVSAVTVVAPPVVTVSRTTKNYRWSEGAGTRGATWQLSVGEASPGCDDPAGVLATGKLVGQKGEFTVDPGAVARKSLTVVKSLGAVQIAGRTLPYRGSLHLRVVPQGASKKPCAGSTGIDLPTLLPGLPQDGQTQLEVYDHPKLATELYGGCDVCQSGPYDPNLWSPSSAVAWDKPGLSSRPFHWSTTAPGTTQGRWELSAAPLPGICKPGGVLASGTAGFAPGPLVSDSTTSPPLFTVDFGPLDSAGTLKPDTTYYLRVVPLGADGACTGPASAPVTLTYQPPSTATPGCPPAGCIAPPKPPPALAHISTQVTAFQRLTGPSATPPYCFQALVDHTVGTQPGDMISDLVGVVTVGFGGHIGPGQEVCYSPPTGGDDSFWGELTSVVNTIVDIVSFPAKVYDLYTAIIPNILAEIIPGCDDTCRGVLLTVEKAALTAVGLPPSLPDASRLVNDGENYFIEQAGEATGLPPEAIKVAYEQGKQAMIGQLAAASSTQTGFTCDWCAFDNGVRSPSVTVQINRPADDDPSLPYPKAICVGNTSSPVTPPGKFYIASPLYYGGCAAMPTVFPPGATLSLPIALSANTSAMRQADVNADGQSQSQFTHSESEYDELALQTWLGQQENTPTVAFTSSTQTPYDAGGGYGPHTVAGGVSTSTFNG